MFATGIKQMRPDRARKKRIQKHLRQVVDKIGAPQADHLADFFLPAGGEENLATPKPAGGTEKVFPIQPS
jgi:hypothetical protein